MPQSWTVDQVTALAPDERSIKAAQSLTSPRHWESIAQSEHALWGECRGSGKRPYQVRIDLREPAFRCSCPSRKFPCKHALALFLMHADQMVSFPSQTPPDWVDEWLEARAQRAAQQAERVQQKQATPVGASTSASRRSDERQAKIAAGLEELDNWLQDLVRQGLASVQQQAPGFWQQPAARLVDAQAPGAARDLLTCASIPNSGPGWPGRLLSRLSLLHLLAGSFQRLDQLPEGMQADLRAAVGWAERQDDILQAEGVRDHWSVLGQRLELEEKLKIQRTWLWGQQSQRFALVLSFAHGRDPLDTSLLPGMMVEAELVFYPSAYPLRALVKDRSEEINALTAFPNSNSIASALAQETDALAHNPWLPQIPLVLTGATPMQTDQHRSIQDEKGAQLPLDPQFADHWHLLALSGGRPLTLMGEWDGQTLFPLGVWLEDEARFSRLRSDPT